MHSPDRSRKGVKAMGDKKSRKDKAKGQKQHDAKQANAARDKQARLHSPKSP